ncbi:MAG: class I SAM-dependent methyltransferase [Rhodospirillaceae bacterium]|nr:class I SAM-dependent methyltransferase [Rhodospirillaceae bacterium]
MATPDDTPREADGGHWFGYRRVDATEKTTLVQDVFSSVAGRYDLMNDLMSGGIHRIWKRQLLAMIRPRPGTVLVDVAGGTGDVSLAWLDAVDGDGRAIICDASEEMLSHGRDRAMDRGFGAQLQGAVGLAEALPLPDRTADVYTIAFGLRNVTHIDAALAEARRVLKPGGRFYCLEFSRVLSPGLRRLYDAYSFAVIPRLGHVVAGDREAYQYLVESIRQFPDQPTLAGRMAEAGLWRPRWRNLSGGIAAIHTAWRT